MDQDAEQAPHTVGTPGERGATSRTGPPVPRVGSDGKPVYDQEFFLALARCGKSVWNKWLRERRLDEPPIFVTFAGVDFRATENAMISFSGFVFGDGADFSGCKFRTGVWQSPGANLSDATFGANANLSGAIFGDWADLGGATFGEFANLSRSTFGSHASLSGAIFDDWANLARVSFGKEARLLGVSFGSQANLFRATFGNSADLTFATFKGGANLSRATFGDNARLPCATLEDADLSGATFGDWANLGGATFGNQANLSSSSFGVGANLSGASFGARTDLSRATFGDSADFCGWSFDEWKRHRSEWLHRAPGDQQEREKALWPSFAASRPNSFSSISFAFTTFRGHADFSGREMGETVDFRSTLFGQPPRFDSMANVDLYGAKIGFMTTTFPWVSGWTTRSDVANQLRRLRKLAEGSQNHDLERDLYIEERKAERGIYFMQHLAAGWNNVRQRGRQIANVQSGAAFSVFACMQLVQTATRLLNHLGWVGVMFFYWLLADYGRSFLRPFTALLLSILLFHAAYWLILRPQPATNLWPSISAALSHAVTLPAANDPPFVRAARAFSLANAVPFVGVLTLDREVKERLICGDRLVDEKRAADQGLPLCVPIPPLRFQALALLQTIVSTLCAFFIALALRNYFRVR